jgi:hypothetical protein
MRKFGAGLTDKQIALARRIAAQGLASYSQAVKALQSRAPDDQERLTRWKQQLAASRPSSGSRTE